MWTRHKRSDETEEDYLLYLRGTPAARATRKRRESSTRDLDHIMGSRFKERTGLSKQGITEREYQEWRREKYEKK